jgi:hypothetical protein
LKQDRQHARLLVAVTRMAPGRQRGWLMRAMVNIRLSINARPSGQLFPAKIDFLLGAAHASDPGDDHNGRKKLNNIKQHAPIGREFARHCLHVPALLAMLIQDSAIRLLRKFQRRTYPNVPLFALCSGRRPAHCGKLARAVALAALEAK